MSVFIFFLSICVWLFCRLWCGPFWINQIWKYLLARYLTEILESWRSNQPLQGYYLFSYKCTSIQSVCINTDTAKYYLSLHLSLRFIWFDRVLRREKSLWSESVLRKSRVDINFNSIKVFLGDSFVFSFGLVCSLFAIDEATLIKQKIMPALMSKFSLRMS